MTVTDYREVLGRAIEFLPEGQDGVAALIELVQIARDSVRDDFKDRRVVIPGEIQGMMERRVRMGAGLYAEMRDPKGLNWFHRKAIDYLPLRLRCEIQGLDWTEIAVVDDGDLYCRTAIQKTLERIQTSE